MLPFDPHPLRLSPAEEKLELLEYLLVLLETKIHHLNAALADERCPAHAKTRILPEITAASEKLARVTRTLIEARDLYRSSATRH